MENVIEFPIAGVPLDDVELAWLAGYSLAKYEQEQALSAPRNDAGHVSGWVRSLRAVAEMGLAPPALPSHLRQKFMEAVNE